ncbi:universal stress protein [Parasporobacterium paucivorans]|uniref:Nucleotide-binding universal stress protein, UspA family n=1 Tax=Parasporobacterium paucivorans DSM 15970 TaxID=1122934 RepID=A0A1M6KI54_9FIRM|nr:universal stress protein [Parasporobacterium paucivorans]SHJ58584.1 Nucleotide-binding universal stress protein, UspA family [Parasporobacterium paucivorans DSM 15970]
MKILTPVDGSDASVNALKKSIEIAGKYGFSIKLIHVVDVTKMLSLQRNMRMWSQVDGSILAGQDVQDNYKDIALENARALMDSVTSDLDFSGIEVEKQIVFGEPYMKILETAESEGFDLIIMGNRGFSGIKRFFLGSVSQRVISEAKCPVLIIHSDITEE